MQGANGTEQRRLCGMYMLYFAGYMAFFSFYALYLTQHGFSRQALGVIGEVCPRCGRREGEALSKERIDELRKQYPEITTFCGCE